MYGVIDIGSNTIRLAVYQINEESLKPLFNKKNVAGLAGYVDENNNMSKEGIEVAIESIKKMLKLAKKVGVKKVYPFATASLRNINNSKEAIEIIEKACDIHVDLISGNDEARLDFNGAASDYPYPNGVLVDIGGGSTEVLFFKEKEIVYSKSFPIGGLNTYKKCVKNIVPDTEELYEMSKKAEDIFSEIPVPDEYKNGVTCFVGGAGRCAKKLLKKNFKDVESKDTYDANYISLYLQEYENNPRKVIDDILKTIPERINTIIPGLVIIKAITDKLESAYIFTCKKGIREGYLMEKISR